MQLDSLPQRLFRNRQHLHLLLHFLQYLEYCEIYIFLDFNFSPSIFLRLGVPGENLRPGDEVRLMRCIATDSLEMPAYGVLQLLGDNSKVCLAVILFSRISWDLPCFLSA